DCGGERASRRGGTAGTPGPIGTAYRCDGMGRARSLPSDARRQGAVAPLSSRVGRTLALRLRGWSLCSLPHPLAIKAGEIDRIDVERRDPAIAHGVGDDLPGEGEQQA